MSDNDKRNPNLTVSDGGEDFKALPRDMDQPIHKKPRVFLHKPNEDPSLNRASVSEALGSISVSDFASVHETPCFRSAMLPSISSGVGVGALRFVMGGSVFSALNFSSGAFVAVSVLMYNRCQWLRARGKENVRQAAAVLQEKERLKVAGADGQQQQQQGGPAAAASSSSSSGAGDGGKVNFWSTFKFW